MRATVQGIAIDERLAQQVAYADLAKKVGTGLQLSPDTMLFRRGEVTQIDDQRRVTFIMQGSGDVLPAVPPDRVRQLVRGRTVSAATRQLESNFPLVSPPTIQVWPGFWPILPLLSLRIDIEVAGNP
jgi:hypothetical protein